MMYNRYIPQPDGTYLRRRMSEPAPPHPPKHEEPAVCETLPTPAPPQQDPPRRPQRKPERDVGSFLSQLLPRGFDTGDLIVVLLLLLMAAESGEDQNNALLTLALYLFL